MRQEREQSVSDHEDSGINLLRRFSRVEFIGVPPFSLPKDHGEGKEDELVETRLLLSQEDRQDSPEVESSPKNNNHRCGVFEPFLNKEPEEGNLFENNYGGNYVHAMQLNRNAVERALEIAHLGGKVQLTNLQQSKSRSEVQGNELAAKRFLIFDRKTQKAEEENPYKRVVSTPEGWRIEINDQRITEELTEGQKLTGEKLQRSFVNIFNVQLREGLRECVWREKLSSEKDKEFKYKFGYSLAIASVPPVVDIFLHGGPRAIAIMYCIAFLWVAKNNIERIMGSDTEKITRIARENVDSILEFILPPVEVDKVARTFAYLAGKGRTLVRETKD